ncbi:MAG TPA: hypothetical protein VHT03_12300 [Rhizomicrobium sp.]|nr:hypothetical protein [Rhizomicrobium sp.]
MLTEFFTWRSIKGAFGRAKIVWAYGRRIFDLESRVERLEKEMGELKGENAPRYRACPQCGKRDYRPQATYEQDLDPFSGQSILHKHWLCYSCGHTKDEQTWIQK